MSGHIVAIHETKVGNEVGPGPGRPHRARVTIAFKSPSLSFQEHWTSAQDMYPRVHSAVPALSL